MKEGTQHTANETKHCQNLDNHVLRTKIHSTDHFYLVRKTAWRLSSDSQKGPALLTPIELTHTDNSQRTTHNENHALKPFPVRWTRIRANHQLNWFEEINQTLNPHLQRIHYWGGTQHGTQTLTKPTRNTTHSPGQRETEINTADALLSPPSALCIWKWKAITYIEKGTRNNQLLYQLRVNSILWTYGINE